MNNLTQESAAKLLGVSRATIARWILIDELSTKTIQKIDTLFHDNNFTISGNNNTIFSEKVTNSHIDNRQYYSDSPDVLRAQIDILDERIKEKDAQIKEKDAQIKDLHEIIKGLTGK